MATLCDAAIVRENLLFVLGGGATHINRPVYPAPLGATLALQFLFDHDDAEIDHKLQVVFQAVGEENAIAQLDFDMQLKQPDQNFVPAGEVGSLPFVPPVVPRLPVPRVGHYVIKISLDGQAAMELPLSAIVLAEALPIRAEAAMDQPAAQA